VINQSGTTYISDGSGNLTGNADDINILFEGGFLDDDTATTTFAPIEDILPDTNPKTMRATDIAAKASDLVGGDRDRQHGAKRDNFARIGMLWDAWVRIRRDPALPIGAHDVGAMMVLMKLARTQSGALNLDDYVDACGYAACAGEVAQTPD